MEESRKYRSHSIDFKLRVLQEYCESGMSKHGLERKYDLAPACIRTWLRQFESGSLSLPPDLNELEREVFQDRGDAGVCKSTTFPLAKNRFV